MTVGEHIRAVRKAKGLTQKQLGEKLGVSYVNISQLEGGQRIPSLETLQKMADAMGLTIRDMIPKADPVPDEDDEYEMVLDVLSNTHFSIEAAGRCYGDGPDDDIYYVWHTDAEFPEEDRVELTFGEIRGIVQKVQRSAELKKHEYIRKRLDAELFSFS